MANKKVSQLSATTEANDGVWIIMNNSGNTETFRIKREDLLSGTSDPSFILSGTGDESLVSTYYDPTDAWGNGMFFAPGKNFIFTNKALQITSNGDGAVFIGGDAITIVGNSSFSRKGQVVIGGYNNSIGYGESIVIGGSNHSIEQQGIIIGGRSNLQASGAYGFIIGSENGENRNSRGGILGGFSNRIFSTGDYSVILGGYDNDIVGGTADSIVGGELLRFNNSLGLGNSIYKRNHLAGGYNNLLQNTLNSAIIGGSNNVLSGTTGSTILGGSGITGTSSNTTYVDKFYVVGQQIDFPNGSGKVGGKNNIFTGSVNEGGGMMFGEGNTFNNGQDGSVVIGGSRNNLTNALQSVILAGDNNILTGGYNKYIIGSSESTIGANGRHQSVFGGFNNDITSNTLFGGIILGYDNRITSNNANAILHETIINGEGNTISSSGKYNTIINGIDNTLSGTTSGTTLIGLKNFTSPTENDTTYVDNIQVINKVVLRDYTNLDYADDAAAASGGIPLGGVYHTSGALKVRTT